MYARVSERPSPALEVTDRDPAGSVIGVVQYGLHGENGSRRRVTLCSRVAAAAHQVIAGIARGPAREMLSVLDLGKHLDAAGGGEWFSHPLRKLPIDARIF